MSTTLQSRFNEAFATFQENIALECGKQRLTYSELDQLSQWIAQKLRAQKVPEGAKVGVLMESRWGVIPALLGILRARCVFVPLDVNYPKERTRYMMETAELACVLTDERTLGIATAISSELDSVPELMVMGDEMNGAGDADCTVYGSQRSSGDYITPDYQPTDPVYIYFTSGSTGNAKAILGKNVSLAQFVDWEIGEFGIDQNFRFSQFTSQCHDPFLRDIFVPLFAGGTICIPEDPAAILEPVSMRNWLVESKIHLVHCTPSLFEVIKASDLTEEQYPDLQYILLAGEKVIPQKLQDWYQVFGNRIQLVNLYGPTETTLAKLFYRIDPKDCQRQRVPIGQPIRGARAIILNEKMQACKVGQVGEIYIRTPFSTHGYYKNENLTREKFVQNPFNPNPADLIYKTGDLGKLLPDGNIEFMGRIDRQVKIRGYRVELEEIETALGNLSYIRQGAVIERTNLKTDHNYIDAFYVVDQAAVETFAETVDQVATGAELGVEQSGLVSLAENRLARLVEEQLREDLKAKLPEYMIPVHLIRLEEIPTNRNGKIDYKELEQVYPTHEEPTVAPKTEVEKRLVQIWSEILGVDRLGIKERFFDVGGHSLNAMNLLAEIYQEFKVNLKLAVIFDNPNIEILAQQIEKTTPTTYQEIRPLPVQEYYSLSSAQKRMYLLSNLEGESLGYNITNAFVMEGQVDLKRLDGIFKKLIQRHEILRTSFTTVNGEVMQKVDADLDFAIEYFEAAEEQVEQVIEGWIRPFDLATAPLIRVGLIKVEEQKHILVIDLHHIIADGTSVVILMNEFVRLYNDQPLDPMRIQYKDFAAWYNQYLISGEMKEQEEYWKSILGDGETVTNLPTDYPRPAQRTYAGDSVRFRISKEETQALKELVQQQGMTMNTVLFTIYSILISKYCNQEELIVGSLIAGRRHPDLTNVIGVFPNFLPIKTAVRKEQNFLECLDYTSRQLLNAFENQDYPFEKMIELANISPDHSRNPLFDTMLIYHNQVDAIVQADLQGVNFSPYTYDKEIANLDLKLDVVLNEEQELACRLQYNTALYSPEFAQRMSGHFGHLVHQILEQQTIRIKDLEMITAAEKEQIIQQFNDTRVDTENTRKLYELIEEVAAETPERVAVTYQGQKLTYGELNERANQLARVLLARGLQEEDFVGIMISRSEMMVISILAVWKAGGAYIPIDIQYPKERVLDILSDSESRMLLVNGYDQEELAQTYLNPIVDLAEIQAEMVSQDATNLGLITPMGNLAYAIYTSGSTGKPKGAMIEHAGMMNHIQAKVSLMDLDQESIIVQNASPCFDISVWQFFCALAVGGKTVIISDDEVLNLPRFLERVHSEQVTILEVVPSYLTELLKILKKDSGYLANLDYLMVTGEELKKQLVADWFAVYPNLPMINAYGPTEASDDITHFLLTEVPKLERVPIGKTVQNLKIYIVTEEMHLCPIGITGELCVEGIGVGRGYIHREELTQKHFCQSPFNPEARMYKTGDLARWLPDGNIEFFGRIDHQVKVRGFRIELGEIEIKIQSHPAVSSVAVILKSDATGEKSLYAFLEGNQEIEISKLREDLLEQLPDYMIPSYFVQVEKMPLTPNGKIDRKALLNSSEKASTGIEYVAPRNELESTLCQIYAQVLKVEQVGLNDNFFDLGGHSLKATNLVLRIHEKLDLEVPLHQVFTTPTVLGLSRYIADASEHSEFVEIQPVKLQEYYPASSIQQRIYALQMLDAESVAYNIPMLMILEGELNQVRVEQALNALMRRHEILRTSFALVENQLVQKLHQDVELDLVYFDAGLEEVEETLGEFVQPFDLGQAPLFRVGIVKVDVQKHLLLIDIHHSIADGSSIGILKDDFVALYAGEDLEPLKVQYKDYATWHNDLLQTSKVLEQKEYWMQELAGEIPVLNLPTDYPRPTLKRNEGALFSYQIGHELTAKIYQFVQEEKGSLFMVLLEAYSILLSKYSSQEDLVVGTVAQGRTHRDLEQVVGVFLNNLAFRCTPTRDLTVLEYLEEIKEKVLQGYDHQLYPIESLIQDLDLEFNPGRKPLFDVMLILQNFDRSVKEISGLRIESNSMDTHASEYDLTLYVAEDSDGGLQLGFEYSTELFAEKTVERMAGHLEMILQEMLNQPTATLSQLQMITPEERVQILEQFNPEQSGQATDSGLRTLNELFEEQVAKTPDRLAVVDHTGQLTYGELNQRANQLARLIQQQLDQGEQEPVVALRLNRSMEMIIGILATLKAGAAYLPIDSSYPEERIKYMLEENQVQVILAQSDLLSVTDFAGIMLALDDQSLYRGDDSNLVNRNCPESLAYIIYTSGTTGVPKGILTEHQNVVAYVETFNQLFAMDETSVTLQQASCTFDGFVEEVYTALFTGGKVVIPKDDQVKDVEALRRLIGEEQVTILSCSPLILAGFNRLEPMDSVKIFLSSSDLLKAEQYDRIIQYAQVYNMYGPSETTVCATLYPCTGSEQGPVSIGQPITNYKVYILDEGLNLLPPGVPGEICIGGLGVARGYLNNPELTAAKFISNPLNSTERLYRTGDIGSWQPDGTITFHGRKDDQIKIRGYRIELAEVEKHLLSHPQVEELLLHVMTDQDGNKELAAYLVGAGQLSVGELRKYLLSRIPGFMIPGYFVQIEQIPMNNNGKPDRKALPKPGVRIETGNEYIPPRNDTEKALVEIWQEVLGVKSQISVRDRFFELGGNSLKIVTLANTIYDHFQIKISMVDLFTYDTVEDLAAQMVQQFKEDHDELAMIMNRQGEEHLFCFPPIIGYGAIYRQMADQLPQYCLHAFNFVEDEARLSIYADYIMGTKPVGELVFFGYSAGGNLAFEVAQELEARGRHVARIIMLDSDVTTLEMIGKNRLGEEERRANLEFALSRDPTFHLFTEEIVEKTAQYSEYFNRRETQGKVDCEIHLIKAGVEDESKDYRWQEFTSGNCLVYMGSGDHLSMLAEEHLVQNMQMISKILQG